MKNSERPRGPSVIEVEKFAAWREHEILTRVRMIKNHAEHIEHLLKKRSPNSTLIQNIAAGMKTSIDRVAAMQLTAEEAKKVHWLQWFGYGMQLIEHVHALNTSETRAAKRA